VPKSVLDDRRLDITVVTARTDMLAFGQAALHGDVYETPGVVWGRGERIVIERLDGQPVLYEHDGELIPQTTPTYELSVLPAALNVLTPAETPPSFLGAVTS
jgi:diacylglycerol kinase (ATP)